MSSKLSKVEPVLPAYAGVIRVRGWRVQQTQECFPHTRGWPLHRYLNDAVKLVLPLYAGVIPLWLPSCEGILCAPRVCGGAPTIY